MIDAGFIEGLSRFSLIVRKRVTSSFAGPRRSIFTGRGTQFKDHRAYAPGDDFRAIDWKVFGRTDDLFVKNYEEEKNLIVHIIVDQSGSMDFGKKFDYASMLGVGFAYLALRNNDKFQFTTFAEDIEPYRPRRGASQLVAMVDYLNGLKPGGKTDFVEMATAYRQLMGSRSLVILISDFLADIDTLKETLAHFRGHEVRAIQVLDEREVHPNIEGEFKLEDAEYGTQMRMYFAPRTRDEYLQRLDTHKARLRNECESVGVDFVSVDSSIPIFDAFFRALA